jgi:hypothetical protein
MQKSLPLPPATPGQNRGLRSKKTKYLNSISVRGQVSAWLKNRSSLKIDKKEIQDLNSKNMSADNLPQWTKFELADNPGLLKTEFTFRLHFFTSNLPSWTQKRCSFIGL